MSFITQVTISIVTYFIIRFSVKGENSLYLSAIISSGIYIGAYLYIYDYIKFLPTIHFITAGLCLLFLFIAYCEIVILERNIKKIKTGNLTTSTSQENKTDIKKKILKKKIIKR